MFTWIKFGLAAAAAIALAFAAGRLTGKHVETVAVRDEEYTRQQIKLAREKWERDSHSTTTSTSVVVRPCKQPPPPPGGCRPPCAQDCSQCPTEEVSSTTTTTTDTHEHGSSASETNTVEHGTSHEETHTTVTHGGAPGLFGARGLTLTLSANAGVDDWTRPSLSTSFGLTVSHPVIGPVGASLSVFTDDVVMASGSLTLGRLTLSPGVAVKWGEWKPSYGGEVSYDLVGPISVGAWAYTSKSAGLSVGVSIP